MLKKKEERALRRAEIAQRSCSTSRDATAKKPLSRVFIVAQIRTLRYEKK